MAFIWERESQSALSPLCCHVVAHLVGKDPGRSCSLLERACSFWIPRVGDLLLRTRVFMTLLGQTSWELCCRIACEFPETPGPFDSNGSLLPSALKRAPSPNPTPGPNAPSCCIQFWEPALECLPVCCSAVPVLWQHWQYFVAIFQSQKVLFPVKQIKFLHSVVWLWGQRGG